jgi:hypothetical protein
MGAERAHKGVRTTGSTICSKADENAGRQEHSPIVREGLWDNSNDMLTGRWVRPLFEVVITGNVLAFTTFAFPLVRRVFPRLIANDLVSVQPMSQPTGKIFYFDILYSPALVGSPLAYNRVDLPANFSSTYAQAAEAASVPQLSLQIESVDVSAITKKLSAKWSMESEQDLFAYHGLNAENELMTATGDEIAREIDRDIIAALFAFAGAGNVTWHSTVPTSGAYSLIDPKAYNRTIMDAITDANNLIFKKRYRNANWIVCGTNTAARLEKLDEFRLFPAADPVGTIVYGPHLFGTISGRWTVYKDPWLDVVGPGGGGVGGGEVALLGYKGTTPLDTGCMYAPSARMVRKGPKRKPPIERFWKFVECLSDGCWLWLGFRYPRGYGLFSPRGREHSVYAHRWSYEYFVGPIADGLEVAHLCGNPGCVNPDHLTAVTHRENLFQTETSARLNAEKTHCVKGHEYTPENTVRTREEWRQCKECKRLSMRGWYQKNRQRVLGERRKLYRETHEPPAPKTHCKRGHPFDEENTYVDGRGDRVCKECRRLAQQQFRLRMRDAARSAQRSALCPAVPEAVEKPVAQGEGIK